MKKFLSLLLTCFLLTCFSALAEEAAQTYIDSRLVGVWIETEGYGKLTLYDDGTAVLLYHDGRVFGSWELTDEGGIFTNGQRGNIPMVLLDDNTLSVAGNWLFFVREGFPLPTDEALLLSDDRVGEKGYPFCGKWVLEDIVIHDESYSYYSAFADRSVEMTFTRDGLVTYDDGIVFDTFRWFVSRGNAVMEGTELVLNEEGKLVMENANVAMYFTLIEPEIFEAETPEILKMDITEPETPTLEEEGAAFLGLWSLETIDLDGMQIASALIGMNVTMTFSEDGSVLFDDGINTETLPWHVENSAAIVDDTPLTINEEGKLLIRDSNSTMIFIRGEAAPAGELSEEEQLLALLELPGQLAEADEANNTFDYLNTRFVCTQYTISGYTLDADTLGAEYALYFREDGTADHTRGGILLENLPYSINEDSVYTIYYSGTFYNCFPTATGFDMDYYGMMMMHFVPAE